MKYVFVFLFTGCSAESVSEVLIILWPRGLQQELCGRYRSFGEVLTEKLWTHTFLNTHSYGIWQSATGIL